MTIETTQTTATETRKPLHPMLARFVQQDPEEVKRLQEEVRVLAKERNAVIMAHNYQVPEVQDVADFVGDSLGLAIEATKTTAPVIVLCGVYFMAETAKLLNPTRIVMIPDETAGCSLADSITVEQLREWKAQHPGAVVVSYVNTTADDEGGDRTFASRAATRRPSSTRSLPTRRSCSCPTCTWASGSRSRWGARTWRSGRVSATSTQAYAQARSWR